MKTQPFHESIIDAINNCKTRWGLLTLGELLMITKVSHNHEEIIKALKAQEVEFGWNDTLLKDKLLKESVIIREKSDWQKEDCLFCGGVSTKEAVYKKTFIRCCKSKKCQDEAKGLALVSLI